MSDFTNGFWSWSVAIISVLSILACGLLLWLAGKAKVSPNIEDNTTGHVWDGDLRELNNPLPRWWLWLFIITIVFSLAYLVIYPGLGSFKGTTSWTSVDEHANDVAKLRQRIAPLYAEFAAQPVEALAKDQRALAVGERLFMNNCSQCHGSDARGSKGYPNLTNGNAGWLGDRSADYVVKTITHGREGLMPPMAEAIGTEADLSALAHYVLSLSASPHNELKAFRGKSKFAACAACHGVDGKGNTALGAPNLTDDYWLHGWGEAAIVNIVKTGRHNIMPAQSGKLTEEQIHVLAAYVLSLAGPGQIPVAKPAVAAEVAAPAVAAEVAAAPLAVTN